MLSPSRTPICPTSPVNGAISEPLPDLFVEQLHGDLGGFHRLDLLRADLGLDLAHRDVGADDIVIQQLRFKIERAQIAIGVAKLRGDALAVDHRVVELFLRVIRAGLVEFRAGLADRILDVQDFFVQAFEIIEQHAVVAAGPGARDLEPRARGGEIELGQPQRVAVALDRIGEHRLGGAQFDQLLFALFFEIVEIELGQHLAFRDLVPLFDIELVDAPVGLKRQRLGGCWLHARAELHAARHQSAGYDRCGRGRRRQIGHRGGYHGRGIAGGE